MEILRIEEQRKLIKDTIHF